MKYEGRNTLERQIIPSGGGGALKSIAIKDKGRSNW